MTRNPCLRRLPLILICLFVNASAVADEAAKDYEVKFARPIKVGMKYEMTADGALLRQTTVTRGGTTQKQPEDGFGIHLSGTVEVLALDDLGEEAKVSITIEKCTRLTSQGESELIPKDGVLIAEGKGKDTKFSLEGGAELSKDAADALDLVVSLDTNDKFTDDDLLGTSGRKKVGESWPVSSENIARDSERVNVIVKPEDVEGSFRIDGLEKKDGVECLKMSGNMKVKNLVAKADESEDDGLPEGFVVEGGSMDARYAGLFPLDLTVGSLSESASITFVTHISNGSGKDGAVKVESRVQRAVEMKRRFLP